MKITKRVIRKLKSNRGESLPEILAASLIFALAFLMAASMVMASFRILERTQSTIDAYYSERNAFEEGSADTSSGHVVISSAGINNEISVSDTIDVTISSKEITDSDSNVKKFTSYTRNK